MSCLFGKKINNYWRLHFVSAASISFISLPDLGEQLTPSNKWECIHYRTLWTVQSIRDDYKQMLRTDRSACFWHGQEQKVVPLSYSTEEVHSWLELRGRYLGARVPCLDYLWVLGLTFSSLRFFLQDWKTEQNYGLLNFPIHLILSFTLVRRIVTYSKKNAHFFLHVCLSVVYFYMGVCLFMCGDPCI